MKKLGFIIAIILAVLIFPNISGAFNAARDCDFFVEVSTIEEIDAVLDKLYEPTPRSFPGKEPPPENPYLKNDKYVVCFKSLEPVSIDKVIEIKGKDKHILIYGLNLLAKKEMDIFTDEEIEYKGLFINLSGSNITLTNSNLEGATQALSITGSNIILGNSEINAKEVGITLTNASNVLIKDTSIIGDGTPESKGLIVENSTDVKIKTGDQAIENFEYGVYVESGTGINVTETIFNIQDPAKAIYWANLETPPMVDINMVGKVVEKLEDGTEIATRIAGKAPMGTCSLGGSENISLYIKKPVPGDVGNFMSEYKMDCPISSFETGEDLCIYLGESEHPESIDITECVDSGTCKCFKGEDCTFNCTGVHEAIKDWLFFVYTDSYGNTYSMTSEKIISDLADIIATIELISDPGSTTGSGLMEGSGGDDPVGADSLEDDLLVNDDEPGTEGSADSGEAKLSAEGDGGDIDIGSPLGGGLGISKMGCSLVPSAPVDFTLLIIFVILLTLCLLARIKIRVNIQK